MLPLPPIVGHGREAGALRFELDLPPDCPAFAGHFPEAGVLPGIVQVDWAIRLAAGDHSFGRFTGISALKFQRVIRPGSRVQLVLEPDSARGQILFRYQAEGRLCSSGCIEFQPA